MNSHEFGKGTVRFDRGGKEIGEDGWREQMDCIMYVYESF